MIETIGWLEIMVNYDKNQRRKRLKMMLIETVGWLKMQNRHKRERGEWVQWRLRNNCDDDSYHDHDGDDEVNIMKIMMITMMLMLTWWLWWKLWWLWWKRFTGSRLTSQWAGHGLPTKVTVNIGQIWNGRGAFEDDDYLDCEIFGDMMMLLSF